jgi:acyl-coenzyme A synthetase/AMP-(fatty) acid ligase
MLLHTGDQFWADDEGFLYYVGRHDDMFTCQGQKVSPREVETVVYELESVAEVGVVGVPDEVDGMAIKVVVAPRGGLTVEADDIRDHCRRRLEQRLVPRYVEVRETLPKTASGKILRRLLRDGQYSEITS